MENAIELINEVLASLGGVGLFHNPDFVINEELQLDNYLQFEIRKNQTHPKFVLIISGGDIRIDIDRAEEAYSWSSEQVQTKRDEISAFIKMLFTSAIRIEYCGSHYTRFLFLDVNGKCINTLRYVTGIYFRLGCKTIDYTSIY